MKKTHLKQFRIDTEEQEILSRAIARYNLSDMPSINESDVFRWGLKKICHAILTAKEITLQIK